MVETTDKMINFVKTDNILKDMCGIIESSRMAAYKAVNTELVKQNWLLGYRIASEEFQGEDRAEYGAEIIKRVAKELTTTYGKGLTKTNLYHFYSFYKAYPDFTESYVLSSATRTNYRKPKRLEGSDYFLIDCGK